MMCYTNPILQKQLETLELQEQTRLYLAQKNKERAREQLLRIQLILSNRDMKPK